MSSNLFIFLSKFLPLWIYPLGLAILLLILGVALARRPRLLKTCVVLALIVLWLGGNSWVSKSLRRGLEWQYLPPQEIPNAEVIVLLGGGTESQEYPRQTAEVNGAGDRVIYTTWLYKQGKAPHILLSSGRIDWLVTDDSPTRDMAELLQIMGVPEQALWMEGTSRNTYENAVNSRQILEEKGIHRIILVTSAMHMPRSVGLFRKQGFEVIPAPADFSVTQVGWAQLWSPNLATQIFNFLPSADNLAATTLSLKEYIGYFIYRLRGWL
jgi:uncharacterized SAM-binding protein YcdF (DUF218 family)